MTPDQSPNPDDAMSAEDFEPHRSYLRGLAYRMLGSRADAEDMVQDAWLRWQREDRREIANSRAFLARTVTRLCLDRLKSARARRETYPGSWLPEPVVADAAAFDPGPEAASELAQDLSNSFLLVLERLSPLERAAFLLHDVFDMGFGEVARLLDRSEPSCRQLASRARKQVRSERPRFALGGERSRRLEHAFAEAIAQGDASMLAGLLAEDCTLVSDGGGKVPAVGHPISGRDLVAKVLAKFAETGFGLYELRLGPVNGDPGLVVYDLEGRPLQTVALECDDRGLITRIYVQRNPEKLGQIPDRDAGVFDA